MPVRAFADTDTAPPAEGAEEGKKRSFSTGTALLDDGEISGGVYYFQRDRRRYEPARGRYANNLNHATLTAGAVFTSGFAGGVLGFDFGMFGTADIQSTGSPDHEMNFMPWGDPWHPDWSKRHARDGVSIHKAQIKAKAGPLWAQGGYFQPSGPGVLGVNWSIMPGTYRGVNMGADFGGLSLALAWADAYKAPWYTEMNGFYKNDGKTHVPWLWSAGARYVFASGLLLEAAYGESKDHLWSAHVKSGYERSLESFPNGRIRLGFHLYLMGDSDNSGKSANDNFDGTASQHFAFAHLDVGRWLFKLEGTYSRAPYGNAGHAGNFVYRLTDRNGSSKGSYEAWWDAHTDWNAHGEKAVFAAIRRDLDDLMPLPGFAVEFGAGMGWDGKAYGVSRHLKEWAFTLDLSYTKPEGTFKGAFVKLHVTEYRNGTDFPNWAPYKNAFQSERDIKFFAGVPFDL